ncbi:hypothetical protein SAMN06265379_105176 [Saccharicrinis carchari]|uniref:Uncharacterized protein n=1 Tax=Saccharicrinis carchari TaxID=1168039 RepID=A0A521DH64_SACCC|nr:hypothetical protein [Saccharicrinis carchari]SMO70976.1 hypothetical protein SAMN06265379_105176 [Saccharicrinis carchari]
MEKRKLKKLRINRIKDEFPMIGENEQMTLIGGAAPPAWLYRLIVGAAVAYGSGSGQDDGGGNNSGNSGINNNTTTTVGFNNTTIINNGSQPAPDSTHIQRADSIGANGTTYGPTGITHFYGGN